jgi:hypothetical protein
MDYNVGDIVWVVLNKKPGLVVLQVSEQVIKRTLAGEETIYHLRPMNARAKNDTVITLDQIPGTIYRSADEARTAMISSATAAIDDMITEAQTFIAPTEEPLPKFEPKTVGEPADTVVLPDGTKARLNIPEELRGAIS